MESATEPVEAAAEPVIEAAAEPVIEAAAEPVIEAAIEPESEPEPEPIIETTDTMIQEDTINKESDMEAATIADMAILDESTFDITDGEASDESSVITQGMTINGDVTSEGSLDVLGTINGNIAIKGKLTISGSIKGDSRAAEIFADSAKITGQMISTGSVKIGQASVILGNVTGTSAVIAGAVKGDIDVHGPVILDTSAIVMGDIKSKSVQINNGAVIEGHCSQCYADVSPTSFFQDIKK